LSLSADGAGPALADILAAVVPVETGDDGALIVRYDHTVASLRTVTIADGLEMISLTQVLAWDLPVNADLRKRVAAQADTTNLGTVGLLEQPGKRADVMLRYNFPSGGLADHALQTLVLMVLAGGAEVARALVR
jgi:hypothetical protein